MSDNQGPDWLAFVSDSGHIIGIGQTNENTMKPDEGMAVAVLQQPTTLIDWLDTLHKIDNLNLAVRAMVESYGGERVFQSMDLRKATLVPFLGTVVGEA
jgi:hypothetical protein